MQKAGLIANPFALMMEPEAVYQAMERSDRLKRLQSRICRPLDKPLIPKIGADVNDFDHAVDCEPELDFSDESTS